MTVFLQELVDRGMDVRAVPIQGGWLEFDTKEDYERVLRWDKSGHLADFIALDELPCHPSVLSAGGVVARNMVGGREILLVGNGASGSCRIPKGMQEPGETIAKMAIGEVSEETAVLPEIVSYIGCTGWSYEYQNVLWDEHVHFFLMSPTGELAGSPDEEHPVVMWLSVDRAIKELRFDTERTILRQCIPQLGRTNVTGPEKGPAL